VYDTFASVDEGVQYDLQGWLKQFIHVVGLEKSRLLIESAGVVVTGSTPLLELDPKVLLKVPSTQSTEDEMVQCIVYYYYDSLENQQGLIS
jgi:hypothetical protein